jgi:hypothetical protein
MGCWGVAKVSELLDGFKLRAVVNTVMNTQILNDVTNFLTG